jgi:glutathione S-transferase
MEGHLTDRQWFVGEHATIADIALYAYSHIAGEGGFDLAAYPAVRAWLDRVAAQPGHITITQR